MKNKLLLLTVFILLVSIPNAYSRGAKPPQVKPLPPALQTSKPGVTFSPVKNYTEEELSVLIVAEKLANDLLKSQCFQTFMVNRKLIETNSKTPLEVVTLLKATNLAVPVEMYYKNNGVVGYRQPPALNIFTNRKFHAGSTACSRASNLTHEWSHSVGFGHSYRATSSRPYSVPYSINAAFSGCCVCEGKSISNCKILP